YISESLLYTFSDNSRHSDNGVGGMLGGGIPINRFFNIELDGAYSHYNADDSAGSTPWREYLAKVDGQFFYSRNPVFAPYFGIGMGFARERLRDFGQDNAF